MEKNLSTHSHTGVYARIFKDQNKSEILLIKKMRGPYTGMFDLPGGSLEPGETTEQALRREILEEVGCSVLSAHELGTSTIEYTYLKNNEPYMLIHSGTFFEIEISGTPRNEPDGEDSGGCIWMPIKNVTKEIVTPFVFEILKK